MEVIKIGRRTVSNLSRETKVSRQTIYKKMEESNIKYENDEFSISDYDALKNELSAISKINKSKKALPKIDIEINSTGLQSDEQSTLRERLKKAKEQYNFNDNLIAKFQTEADEYFKANKKTTLVTHNGTEAAIPAITSLEKYVKLNIALSKLVSDLESDLKLSKGGRNDPFR